VIIKGYVTEFFHPFNTFCKKNKNVRQNYKVGSIK